LIDAWLPLLAVALAAATPLVLAGTGELITERAGVLNLGVEGMMLGGAVCAFAAASTSGQLWLGAAAGLAGGAVLAAVFGVLTQHLLANQVATGLALTIYAIGLSAFAGKAFTGASLTGLQPIPLPVLSAIPILGPILFNHDVLVYLAVAIAIGAWWFLRHSQSGLVLRSIGESPSAAHALGYPVRLVRYAAILFGGAMAGLAGAYLALAYTPMWIEQMTAGRGWIALALVVFAAWRPLRLLIGAYLFGAITVLQFHAQAIGIPVASQLLACLPYVATIAVLAALSRRQDGSAAPASLGQAFHPGD
jgi:simple sugar transport system permease protein